MMTGMLWYLRKTLQLSLCILLVAAAASALPAETLTDTQGRSIEVEILAVGEESVEVRRSDGYVFDIPLSRLDAASKARLSEKQKTSKTEAYDFAALNELLRLKLWQDTDLWDDPAAEVAKRLGWPK